MKPLRMARLLDIGPWTYVTQFCAYRGRGPRSRFYLRKQILAIPPVIRSGLKVFHHIGDHGESVDPSQFGIHAFLPKPVPHRGAGLDDVKPNLLHSDFFGHASE